VRVLDVGSYYAATRFVPLNRDWTLAVLPEKWLGRPDHNPHTLVAKYKDNPAALRDRLQHRLAPGQGRGALTQQDLETLSAHIGVVTWEQLIGIARETRDPDLRNSPGPW